MSTVPGLIPVALVAFPPTPEPLARDAMMKEIASLRLPVVALLPDSSYDDLNDVDDFHTVIRNTHPDDPLSYLRFRLNALDLLERHTNMEVVGVMEFDHKYRIVWQGIPTFNTSNVIYAW